MAYEDFKNDYTEVDPDNDLSYGKDTKVDVSTIDRDYDCYCYMDKGAGYFTTAAWYVTETVWGDPQAAWSYCLVWGCANTLDDMKGWYDNDNQALLLWFSRDAADLTLKIRDCEPVEKPTDTSLSLTEEIEYFPKITRTAADTLTCVIYTDEGHETVHDTISITIGESSRTYRYNFAVNNLNDGETNAGMTCYIDAMEITFPSEDQVGDLINGGLINSGLINGGLAA